MTNTTRSILEDEFRTTHEHVRFPNGDHVIVHTSPGRVQVTGMLGGEYIEYAGTARDAREQARLLTIGAPDALWAVPDEYAARIGAAMDGAARGVDSPTGDDNVPWADSPEDVHTATVDLDGGTAVVEHTGDRVELTIRLGDRTVLGIALTHMEAANLGRALTSPDGATTGDLFHVADTLGVDAGDILRLRETAHA
ncbi:hypothetical protein [Brachybacterium muris]|uniref:hypothetical protein n=1 Tax=Brachybacterium muris TaxID=219301 RepID=UPI00223B38A9|nr:hypothetical protein [Brachybacterium muris]MCT1653672.1 hypothetical protein [Brachybacterium muris]